uniref:Uncharacterized protein n=1 Tax=Rhizophora mucronata TaxID=61149 RepID=A0A2P2QDI4_RHIMU
MIKLQTVYSSIWQIHYVKCTLLQAGKGVTSQAGVTVDNEDTIIGRMARIFVVSNQ